MSTAGDDKPPILARATLWLCMLSVAALVAWAAYARIDQLTRAPGNIVVSSRLKVLQSLEGGVVAEILAREGDSVRAGQVLLRLDPTRAEASLRESQARQAALETAAQRLKAELEDRQPKFSPDIAGKFPDIVAAQLALFDKRRHALNEELGALRRSLALAREEQAVNERLKHTGDASAVEVLRVRRQVTDLEGQIAVRRQKYQQDSQQELAKVEEELAAIRQVVTQRADTVGRIELTAPIDGIVKNTRAATIGGVIRPGEDILQIVPSHDNLLVEAKVKPVDVAFLKPGLPAVVKIDAYDYTVYGTLTGKVTYISADTFNEENRASDNTYYRVHIETTDRQFPLRPDVPMHIIPGMTASIEIKTGRHTILHYLLKPINKTLAEAMTER